MFFSPEGVDVTVAVVATPVVDVTLLMEKLNYVYVGF